MKREEIGDEVDVFGSEIEKKKELVVADRRRRQNNYCRPWWSSVPSDDEKRPGKVKIFTSEEIRRFEEERGIVREVVPASISRKMKAVSLSKLKSKTGFTINLHLNFIFRVRIGS